jgi:hypothetical protein
VSYGEHAEEAASGLHRLINLDRQPASPSDIDRVLACRLCILNALTDQLRHLGADRTYVATRNVAVRDLAGNATNLLDQIVRTAPRPPQEPGMAPIDALTTEPGRSDADVMAVGLWRRIAVELMAGTHDLITARERPWLYEAGAGWYLVRDVATAVEAVVVLDARLIEVGLLPRARQANCLDEHTQRMIAADIARLATWHATSMAPDLATAAGTLRVTDTTVHTIEQAADFAPAQRKLASMLRFIHGNDSFVSSEPSIDVATARAVTLGQGRLAAHFAAVSALDTRTLPLQRAFQTRQDLLGEIQARLAPMSDIEPHRNRPALFQQQEIGLGLRRFSGNNLSPAQMLDLLQATHAATTVFAQAFRRDLHRPGGNIRGRTREGFKRPSRNHPLSRALTDLANAEAPEQPVSRWIGPQLRGQLRAALNEVPAGAAGRPRPLPRPSDSSRKPRAQLEPRAPRR